MSHNIKRRLEQYATQAKGIRRIHEIAGYTAAVGAGLAMAGGADAGIIYSGVQNISVHLDPAWQATQPSSGRATNLLVDLNHDGAADVLMTMTQNVGKRVGRTYYQEIALLKPRNGAQVLNTRNSSSNIAAGAMVGPGGQFGGFGAFKSGFWRTGMASVSNPGGNWSFNVSGLAGLQLGNGDYAWIRLRFDDLGLNQPLSTLRSGATLQDGVGFPDGMTVVDWAYEDGGTAIAAGDQGTAVPEPTPLALLAAGAVGLGRLRRRSKASPAAVH